MDVAEKKMKILFYHWPSEAVFLQYLFSGLSCLFVLQRKHAMSQHLSTLLQTTAAALEMRQNKRIKKEAAWVLFALVVGFNAGLRTFAFFCSGERVINHHWSWVCADHRYFFFKHFVKGGILGKQQGSGIFWIWFQFAICFKYLSLGFSWIRSSETQLKILFKIWADEILNMIPLWGIQYGCTLHKTEW